MAIRKRRVNGGITWAYYFDLPGSTRENRKTITGSGYKTKKEAQDAEAERRIEELDRLRVAGSPAAPLPGTFGELLGEMLQQAAGEVGPKTIERYWEMAELLHADLLAMPTRDLRPLHFTREWRRLFEAGGRERRRKTPRPLSAKTVANIAGMVSSVFRRAQALGAATLNPVSGSQRPRGPKRPAMALSVDQQRLLVEGGGERLVEFLGVCADLGARRGEVLALRWPDVAGGEARVARALVQSKAGVAVKEPKTAAGRRTIAIPETTVAAFERIRSRQAELRAQFGADYRLDLDLIFCEPDGSMLKPDSVSAAVSALAKRLKLPKGVSLHTLRHTHGSLLIAAGMELPAVSARLGHASTHTTAKVYAHVIQGRDREAAKLWDRIKGGTARRHHEPGTGGVAEREGEEGTTENERVRPN